MVFLSSRIYAGFATTDLNPEPFAFETGFATKWLIEAQINQMRGLGQDARAGNLDYDTVVPWIAWGPYIWANDGTPTSDGLTWLASDFSDGIHPNASGVPKVASRLMTHFLDSPFTAGWFRAAGGPPPPPPPPPPVLVSVAVVPPAVTLQVGETQVLTAIANFSDNSVLDVSVTAVWASSNPSIASVAQGLVTGVAPGSADITATYSGLTGFTTATVASAPPPPPPVLTGVVVTPQSATLVVGQSQQFLANAIYSDGSAPDVTASAEWQVEQPAIASVAAGLVTALAPGTTGVRARFGGLFDTSSVTVSSVAPPPGAVLTGVVVTPQSATLVVGQSQQFLATAIYSDGSTLDVTTSAEWRVRQTAVASVTAGLVTALSPGTTEVQAGFSAPLSGSTFVTVVA